DTILRLSLSIDVKSYLGISDSSSRNSRGPIWSWTPYSAPRGKALARSPRAPSAQTAVAWLMTLVATPPCVALRRDRVGSSAALGALLHRYNPLPWRLYEPAPRGDLLCAGDRRGVHPIGQSGEATGESARSGPSLSPF